MNIKQIREASTAELIEMLAEVDRRLPDGHWEVATSNSFRRINGPDGRDGGVLHALVHRDGQPDLSMDEEQLRFLCHLRNQVPAICSQLAAMTAERDEARDSNVYFKRYLTVCQERDTTIRERDIANARADQYLSTMETLQAAIAPRAVEVERLKAFMTGLVVRKFYIDGCSDSHGARVWAAVTDGPAHATSERTRWTVYHRPEYDELYPAKLTHVDSLADAIQTAREIATALSAPATKEGGHGE